jgi:hypothetical protein
MELLGLERVEHELLHSDYLFGSGKELCVIVLFLLVQDTGKSGYIICYIYKGMTITMTLYLS